MAAAWTSTSASPRWSDGVVMVSRRSPSTPGAWSRIACIVRGTATIGLHSFSEILRVSFLPH
jgi:hypothetical protein